MQITYREYYDKVMGAWLGKSAGGIIGFKQENNKSLMNYTFENVFPNILPPNDDFDLQVLWLYEILEKKGLNFDSYDLGKVFAKYNKCWANEYRVAIDNVNCGINPPLSGILNNEYFSNSMGCPIRSEIWALIAPGNISLARELAEMDGSIDHGVESIEGEKFLATLEAEAFCSSDIKWLIAKAKSLIKKDTQLINCINYMIELYNTIPAWQDARIKLVKRFGSCDASYSVINIGIIILALLYGDGDFNKSMLMAVNCGYDTDCTAATCGAILGLIKGYSNIPNNWKEKVGDIFYAGTVDIDPNRNTYKEVAELTVRVGLSIINDNINKECEIIDIPKDLSLNIPTYKNEIKFIAKYLQEPILDFDVKTQVKFILKNEDLKDKIVNISFDIPNHIKTNAKDEKIFIKANETYEFTSEFFLREKMACPSKNLIQVNIEDGINKKSYEIGFLSYTKYKLYGPFFDNYDTTKYDHDIYNGLQQKDENGNVTLFPMFNGYVEIENKYIENDDVELAVADGEFKTIHNYLDIEKELNYKGPCAVYLAREIEMIEDFSCHMIVGNNDAYRIWLNGIEIGRCEEALYWYFQNATYELPLKKGNNKLVIKLIRRNAEFKFSMMLSKYSFGEGVHVETINP